MAATSLRSVSVARGDAGIGSRGRPQATTMWRRPTRPACRGEVWLQNGAFYARFEPWPLRGKAVLPAQAKGSMPAGLRIPVRYCRIGQRTGMRTQQLAAGPRLSKDFLRLRYAIGNHCLSNLDSDLRDCLGKLLSILLKDDNAVSLSFFVFAH